jgi:hypothetical protein
MLVVGYLREPRVTVAVRATTDSLALSSGLDAQPELLQGG